MPEVVPHFFVRRAELGCSDHAAEPAHGLIVPLDPPVILHDHLRYRHHMNETVSLADQRRLFQDSWGEVCALMQAA